MSKRFKNILRSGEYTAALFLVFIFLIVGLFNPSFLKLNNLQQILNGSVVLLIVSLGISFVIFTGEIDVSVGSTLGLSAAVSATFLKNGYPLFFVITISVLLGVIIGFFNGYGINYLHIPSIIMTLGTNGVIRGLGYVYTEGKWVENLPQSFKRLALKNAVGNLSWIFVLVLTLILVLHILVKKTGKGKYFLAVGDNFDGSVLVGIPARRVKLCSFIICAVMAAISGIVFSGRIGFVTPTSGLGYEMKAIAACVLGGVSLSGGVGSLIGAAFGAVIMSSISRILVFLQFPSDYDNMITGILLITIVVLDALINKRSKINNRRRRLLARVAQLDEVENG